MLNRNLPKHSLKGNIIDLFKIDIIQDILDQYHVKGRCILILDEQSSHLISKYFSMTDIISQGIFSIELISKVRKPFETYDAIYIISNTNQSINSLVKDFDYNLDGKQHFNFYKNCHLFIIDPITKNKDILDLLLNEHFLRRIKTFKEIFFDFTALDKNLFYFGQDYNFNPIYQLFCVNDNTTQNNICVKKLYSICLVTQTFPNIIYFAHDPSCKYIAQKLSQNLEKYFLNHKKIVKNGILLITSRLIDLPAPIQFDMNYDHLIFESYKTNVDPDKKMINIDLDGKGKKNIILDHNDILYNKYKLYSIFDILTMLPNDLQKFNESDIAKVNKVNKMDSLNEMNDAIRNFSEYQYKTKLFSQHLDMAKRVNENIKKRNLMNLVDLQSSIMSGATSKGGKISSSEINSQLLENKDFFEKNDLMRLLYLIRYYNPDNDINELTENLEGKININENDLKLIEYFTVERSLIEEEDMKRLNKEIILFRNRNKYNTKEEKENSKDKRYICTKESKLTTICDMCCKNELPENDFKFVERPKLFNNINNKKQYNAKILLENQDMDEESEIPLNIDNLIIFNVGGLSTYEIASLEKANKNKQFGMNIIYGSNQIYNHEEYINYIKDYFKGNSGIVKTNEVNIKPKIPDEDNDSIAAINYPNDTMQYLNESKEQKVNVNLFPNKNNITNDIKTSSIRDTMSYDKGPIVNSFINNRQSTNNIPNKNIRNTIDSDDFYTSDYK